LVLAIAFGCVERDCGCCVTVDGIRNSFGSSVRAMKKSAPQSGDLVDDSVVKKLEKEGWL
jgi:hypothetical protein